MLFRRRVALALSAVLLVCGLSAAGVPPAQTTAAVPVTAGVPVPAAIAPVRVSAASVAAVPRPDHTVVLILENHSAGSIVGNAQAPYLNELAAGGASMTQSLGVTQASRTTWPCSPAPSPG